MTAKKASSKPTVSFALDEIGQGTIEVDGKDVSALLKTFSVDSAAGELTKVKVGLAKVVLSGTLSADVVVDAPTHAFLVSLGWTPPAGG